MQQLYEGGKKGSMRMTGIKFDFVVNGRKTSPEEFENEHFRRLPPAKAGHYIRDMKYQVWDAFCQFGRAIEKDPKIHMIQRYDGCEEDLFTHQRGEYSLELDQTRYVVYFLFILTDSCSTFAFCDVK